MAILDVHAILSLFARDVSRQGRLVGKQVLAETTKIHDVALRGKKDSSVSHALLWAISAYGNKTQLIELRETFYVEVRDCVENCVLSEGRRRIAKGTTNFHIAVIFRSHSKASSNFPLGISRRKQNSISTKLAAPRLVGTIKDAALLWDGVKSRP